MCTYSMIMDHYTETWPRKYPTLPDAFTNPQWPGGSGGPLGWKPVRPTPEEVEEFKALLDRARQYDKKNNEPDCDLESKKTALRELAKIWKIDISFIEKETA